MDSQMRRLEGALYRCNKCGFCQATCPFYQTTREEWAVARGRLRLMRAVLQGKLPRSDGYSRGLYHCFTCGACTSTCPSGVEVEEILLEARREAAQNGRTPVSLVRLGQTITGTGNLTGEPGSARLSWMQNLDFAPRQRGRPQVIYFVGCVSSFYPQAFGLPQSMVRLLERAGVDYALLGGDEICCGYPLFIAGLHEQAREMARANVRLVRESGAQRLVTTCPSCYRAWREFYPRLLEEEPGIEVVHAVEWLLETEMPVAAVEQKVTYHDPCDLGRGSGLYEPPREFLGRTQGLELVEMPYARAEALCCGGGGNMESLDPQAGRAVADLRMKQALETGARWLVTACPQCKRTLATARPSGTRVRVVDIVELAWRVISTV